MERWMAGISMLSEIIILFSEIKMCNGMVISRDNVGGSIMRLIGGPLGRDLEGMSVSFTYSSPAFVSDCIYPPLS
jgi:hypothetical protein